MKIERFRLGQFVVLSLGVGVRVGSGTVLGTGGLRGYGEGNAFSIDDLRVSKSLRNSGRLPKWN